MTRSRWEDRTARARGRFRRNKVYKNRRDGMICGVCAGLGEFFGIAPTVIRIAAILLSIFGFFFPIVVAYIILCWVLEDKPSYLYENEDAFWRDDEMPGWRR
jgi:phage shock protein C